MSHPLILSRHHLIKRLLFLFYSLVIEKRKDWLIKIYVFLIFENQNINVWKIS